MFEWLNTEGVSYKHHVPGQTNYLVKRRDYDGPPSNRPFPNNWNFVSESVLSEELRNEVYAQVVEQKKSVRAVSVQFGIDMRRIAAVVRLVELERRQRAQVRLFIHFYLFPSLLFLVARSLFPTHMMRQQKKSISLEDTSFA